MRGSPRLRAPSARRPIEAAPDDGPAAAEAAKLQGDLETARAERERAKAALDAVEIRSPIRGLVSRRLVDPWNAVGGGEDGLLATIVSTDPMHVYFHVGEAELLKILRRRQGSPPQGRLKVEIGLADEDGYPRQGELDFLDNRLDPASGALLARAVLSNDDGLLRPGLSVRVRLPLEPIPGALLVEERAIAADPGGTYLLVFDESDATVAQRYVEPGIRIDGMRVVGKRSKQGGMGIGADEFYVVEGLQRARPGLRVAAVLAGEAAAPEAAVPREPSPAPSAPASGG